MCTYVHVRMGCGMWWVELYGAYARKLRRVEFPSFDFIDLIHAVVVRGEG